MKTDKPQESFISVDNVIGILLFLVLGSLFFGTLVNLILTKNEPPPWPATIPFDYNVGYNPNYKVKGVIGLTIHPQKTVLVYDQKYLLKIVFDQKYSLHGYWHGRDSHLVISEPYQATLLGKATHTGSWGDTLPESAPLSFTSGFEVEVKLGKELLHQKIKATARMIVTYPVQIRAPGGVFSPGSFINRTEEVERQLEFLVVSPHEYQQLQDYENWKGFREQKGNLPLLIFLGCFSLMLPAGILGVIFCVRDAVRGWRKRKG